MENDYEAFKYAADTIKNNGLVLKYLDPFFRADYNIVRAAIENNAMALQYADRIITESE